MIECSSLLAKLLAEEDIAIMHDTQISSAKFDLAKRVLCLPVYNDMEGDNFDGMMAAEVAHALWTPAKQYSSVSDTLAKLNPEYAQIIKMIEAVRVEKHLKRKYPGLTSTLSKMYLDFWDKNYFGLSHMPLGDLNIVDKLNIGSKVPWFDIPMDSYESTFKHDLDRVESFQDGCLLARDIVDYLRQKQEEYEKSLAENQGENEDEQSENDDGLPQPDQPESDEDSGGSNGGDEQDPENDDESNGDSADSGESDDDVDSDDEKSSVGSDDDQSESDGSEDGDAGDSTDDSESDGNDASQQDGGDCDSEEDCECSGDDGDSAESDGESDPADPTEDVDGDQSSESTDNDDSSSDGDASDGDPSESGESESDGEDVQDGDDGNPDGSDSEGGESDGDACADGDGDSGDQSEGDSDDSEMGDEESENGSEECNVAATNVTAPAPIQSIENYEQSIRENEVNHDAKEMINVSIPIISNYKDLVDPAEVVHKSWNRTIAKDDPLAIKRINKAWLDFKSNERKTVDLMKQMFDMRKNAAELRRTRTAKTGKLDLKKLAFYKVTEDIFKSTTLVDDGTNHGIALILDFSGSMSGARMYQTLRQTLVMVMFAQSVKIPFVVWGFTNTSTNNYVHGSSDKNIHNKTAQYEGDSAMQRVMIGSVALRELINSDLPTITQRQIMRNLFREAIAHHRGKFHGLNSLRPCESLSGTPTNEAMVIASHAIRDWKDDHNVEIMNTLLITDGDSSSVNLSRDNGSSSCINKNFMTHDEMTRKTYQSGNYRDFDREEIGKVVNKIMYDLVRDRADTSMMVMHIGPYQNVRRQVVRYFPDIKWSDAYDSLDKQNCCVNMDYSGVDRLILSIDRDVACEMKLDTTGTMKKLEKDFMNQSRKVLQSKVVADIMLDVISKKL